MGWLYTQHHKAVYIVYAGIFEQMPGYQNFMTEGQLFSGVENS
jgi:hypothetical protein